MTAAVEAATGVVSSVSGSATVPTGVVTNGQFCVSTPTYSVFTIGWPAAGSPVAVLQAGTTYALTYQISTTVTFYSFQVKVGQATPPYTQIACRRSRTYLPRR